jgi:type I restriction enzyme S subunit
MPWPTKKIGEIREEIKKEKAPVGIMPYIEIGNINIESKKINFAEKGAVKGSVFCPEKSILISRVRPTRGAVVLADRKYAVSSAFTIIKPKTNPHLLFYFLAWNKKFFEYLGNLQKGTSYPSVRESDILDFEVSFPEDKVEQKKIVYILDSIQDAIRAQEKIIEKTKELKKSLLNEIFNSKIKNQKWTKLGNTNYFEIKLGGTPKTNVAEYWNGKIYWITPNDLNKLHSQYISNTERKITQNGLDAGSTLLPAGSIILSTRAPIGYLAILAEDMAFNQGCKGIVVKKPDEVSNLYLFYYLSTQISKLRELGSGSTFRELSTSDLERLSIPLVNITQQREIAEILQTIDQKIEIERKKKALYEELFKTMLNKLMTGEIRVDNLKL